MNQQVQHNVRGLSEGGPLSLRKKAERILDPSEKTLQRIVVASENPKFRDELQANLACFAIDCASSGEDFIQMVDSALKQAQPYLVAFVDIPAPPGCGLMEHVLQACKIDPDLQVVLCTPSEKLLKEFGNRFESMSSIAFLKKPFKKAEAAQLAKVLSRKSQIERQLRAGPEARRVESGIGPDLENAGVNKIEPTTQAATRDVLLYTEEFFSKAFWSSPLAMSIQSVKDQRYLDVNQAFLKLVGATREEVIGHSCLELGFWPDQVRLSEFLDFIRDGGSVSDFERGFRTKSGEIRQTLVSADTFERGDERCMLVVIHDISDRIHLEAQLRNAQKLEAVGQLASGVAHHFNNLLAIIQGYVGLVLDGELDPATRQSLKQVMAATRRAALLVKQFAVFGRKQNSQFGIVNLNDVVAQMQDALGPLIGHEILLVSDLSPETPWIVADMAELEQVILNLAVNARDAMPSGGRLTIRTEVVQLPNGSAVRNPEASSGVYVCLTVTDTGCGMDERVRGRLFEPFFTTKDIGQGSGLGLATVYGIVKRHQGWIEVNSQVGAGSTFKVFFPEGKRIKVFLPASVEAKPQPLRQAAAMPATPQGRETVLVVEDEPAVREMMRQALERYGYKVFGASTGADALRIWSENEHQIDLLLTDMVMPNGISGRSLAGLLRVRNPRLKVLLTSGYSLEDCNAGGKTDSQDIFTFLQKPYSPDKLARVVRNCLDGNADLGMTSEMADGLKNSARIFTPGGAGYPRDERA